MYPNHLIDVLIGNETERRRRRDEAWRAWHRRPDAPPLPEEPPRDQVGRLPGLAIGIASTIGRLGRLAGRIQLSRR